MGEKNALDRVLQHSLDTGIRRSEDGRWIAGVCGGLGRRWNVDPVLFRVGFLMLSLFAGIGAALYLFSWLMLPADDSSIPLERAVRKGDGGAMTLLVLTILVLLGTLGPDWDGRPASLVGLVVFVAIVWYVARSAPSAHPVGVPGEEPVTGPPTPPAPTGAAGAPTGAHVGTPGTFSAPPALPAPDGDTHVQPPSSPWASPASPPVPAAHLPSTPYGVPQDRPPTRQPYTPQAPAAALYPPTPRRRLSWLATFVIAGVAILTYLGVEALRATTGTETAWTVPFAAALVVLGGGLVITAVARRTPPLIATTAWIMGATLLISVASAGHGRIGDSGDVLWKPMSVEALDERYDSGAGSAVLDLTAIPATGSTRRITVDHGVGEVKVLLPRGVSADVSVDLGTGSLLVGEEGHLKEAAAGVGIEDAATVGSGPRAYDIHIDQGVGEVNVVVTNVPVPTPTTAPTSRSEETAS